MSLLHTIYMAADVPLAPIVLPRLDPSMGAVTVAILGFVFDGSISCAGLYIGVSLSSPAGGDANGEEISNYRWIEARKNIGETDWTPIGGGLTGSTYEAHDGDWIDIRANVPSNARTWGPVTATLEFYYKLGG